MRQKGCFFSQKPLTDRKQRIMQWRKAGKVTRSHGNKMPLRYVIIKNARGTLNAETIKKKML